MEINVEERVESARSNFAAGYNCAQSVVLAYADIYSLDATLISTISAPFGGGLGRLREVCGAVSGMSMVAGFIAPANDPTDGEAKRNNYKLVQELAEQFRSENGSIICRELLGKVGKKRPCSELVAIAARIVGERLGEQLL